MTRSEINQNLSDILHKIYNRQVRPAMHDLMLEVDHLSDTAIWEALETIDDLCLTSNGTSLCLIITV